MNRTLNLQAGNSDGKRRLESILPSVVRLYRLRWTIEAFFRTLETAGWDIEAADIGEPRAMINLTAATIATVTIGQLVQAREGATGQRLGDAFEPQDQPILEAYRPDSRARPRESAIPVPEPSWPSPHG